MDLLSLPDDVLIQILARLPAKLISQLRCMNKSLLKASSNPYFLSYQSRHTSISNSGLFLQHMEKFEFARAQLLYLDSASGIPKESAQILEAEEGIIVASGRGLVIINQSPRTRGEPEKQLIFLSNPMLPRSPPLRLPRFPSSSVRCHWFERSLPPGSIRCQLFQRHVDNLSMAISFEDAADHYLIICLVPCMINYNHDNVEDRTLYGFVDCMLYDSRVKRWRDKPRRIHYRPLSCNCMPQNPVLSNGMIHHLAVSHIAAFKIHTEEEEEEEVECYPLPDESLLGTDHRIEIAPWRHDSLCLIRCKAKSTFIVWVTNDVRKEDSWVKAHQVDIQKMAAAPQFVRSVDRFTLVNKRQLVFVVTKEELVTQELYVFDFQNGELHYLGPHKHLRCCPLLVYTSTFLQPRLQTQYFS